MRIINKIVVCSLLIACNSGIAMQEQPIAALQQNAVNYTGHELIALDVEIATQKRHSSAEMAATFDDMRFFIRNVFCALLSGSNNPQAKVSYALLQKYMAYETVEDIEEVDGSLGKNFTGDELMYLDDALLQLCQEAVNNNNLDALLSLLVVRNTTLQGSLQLMLNSAHEKVAVNKEECFQRLVVCQAVYKQIITQLIDAQQTDDESCDQEKLYN